MAAAVTPDVPLNDVDVAVLLRSRVVAIGKRDDESLRFRDQA